LLLRRLAGRVPRRLRHAGASAVLVAMTVVLVIQATVGVSAVMRPVGRLLAGPIRVPPQHCAAGKNAVPRRRALVLFDNRGQSAAYAVQSAGLAANFVSHFAQPVRQPVSRYYRGEMADYAAVVYMGATDGDPLPGAFLADVRAGVRPVLWLGGGISGLTNASFGRARGWRAGTDRGGDYTSVVYRGVRLTDSSDSLTSIDIVNPAKATVLATVSTAAGRQAPWAVRSGDLTYIAELALDDGDGNGMDRSFAVADMMAGLFGPERPRHRMTVRLEDVGPATNTEQLRQIADLLSADRVPFAIELYPEYLGPANQHPRAKFSLEDRPDFVTAIEYMLAKGGTLVLHGYTHQLGDTGNPTDGQSGQDYEFLRVHYNAAHVIIYDGAPARDAAAWTRRRVGLALAAVRAAGLPRPEFWTFPEYGASPAEYRVAASAFLAQVGRGNYSENGPGDTRLQTLTEQSPPYLVRDVYGGPVLPETIGYVAQPSGRASGPGSVRFLLAAAAAQKTVVRDNVAGFYYHPFLGTGPLRRLIDGLKREDYQFVSACTVLRG
jgi:uncharacterized protein YdaL